MPPLTDITWNIADSDRVTQSGTGVTFSAVTAPAGPGVLECSVYVPPMPPTTLTLTADLIEDTTPPGYEIYGWQFPAIGAVSPSQYIGQPILTIKSGLDSIGAAVSAFTLLGTGLPQSFFTTIEINGTTFTSASAAFSDSGAVCTWEWAGTWFLTGGGYTVTLT